jgi:hypothetical protein
MLPGGEHPKGTEARPKGRAGVAELVDALDLGSSDVNRGGSNPSARTSAANELNFPPKVRVS